MVNEPDGYETRRDTAGVDDEPGIDETLRGLEARLMQASVAAERLLREAAGRAGAAQRGSESERPGADQEPGSVGATSWTEGERRPEGESGSEGGAGSEPGGARLGAQDLELLGRLLERVRDLIPPELERRLGDALRELLLALRALIDWYLERMERQRAEPPEVKDIPIL